MITIAIADRNEVFSRSLKTLLDQVEGFSTCLAPLKGEVTDCAASKTVDILLIDASLYLAERRRSKKVLASVIPGRTILMVMYRDEIAHGPGDHDYILKNAPKSEYEIKIRQFSHQ